MKKIFAILAMVAATSVMADSVTLEQQNINNVGSADQQQYALGVKKDFTSTLAGDVVFKNTQTDGTNALSTRLEAGLTATQPISGNVSGYVRGAYGHKFSNTTEFGYYSIEPGVSVPFGALTAKVGWRYNSATNSGANADQTHTMRYGVSYALSKVDTVGVRYDRIKGDNDQKVVALNYTRGF